VRHNPAYRCEDPAVVRQLIEENPWATFVSHNGGLVASHYPVLLDADAEELTLLTHLGKPDDELHGIGEGEMLVIVQGQHGYVSPS
jgi:transcriptional regulator